MENLFGDHVDHFDQMMYKAYKKGIVKAFHQGKLNAEKSGGAQGIKELITALRMLKI